MRSSPQLRMRQRPSAPCSSALPSGLLSSLYAQSMLGVTFVLLIINMLVGGVTNVRHSLPIHRHAYRSASPMPEALREDAMRLYITRDGSLYFRNFKTSQADLANAIRQSVQSGAPHKVFFVVDERAKYGDVMEGLDEVRKAGIWEVAFLAGVPYIHKQSLAGSDAIVPELICARRRGCRSRRAPIRHRKISSPTPRLR